MFIGHFAVGLASKRVAPATSLGLLLAAPLLLDLLWPFFLLAGWEEVRIDPGNTAFTPLDFVSYPYSHSLCMAIAWALVFTLVYWACTRYMPGAAVIGVGVLSHWFLDALTHRPDMPLFPVGGPRVGLGLWNSVLGTLTVETALFVFGVLVYTDMTRPKDSVGRYAWWSFVAVLIISYAGNAFGSPPPNVRFLGYFSLVLWLFPLWAGWADRHRMLAPYMRASVQQ